MKGFDEWATDPENKGVYPRGEQKEEIGLGFVKEEDEEIKSLISTEPSEIEEMLKIAISFKNEGNLEAFELIMNDIVKMVVSKI